MDLIQATGRAARCRAGLLITLALATAAGAGEAARSPEAAAEPRFASFLHAFRRALADDDRDALAALTALPFRFEGAGLDATGFRRIVPVLFPPAVRRCLAETRPDLEEDRYVIFCSPYGFYFGRVGGEFRLLEFMADGESLGE